MSESYITQRTAELNKRLEILAILHPLLQDLVERHGASASQDEDSLDELESGMDIRNQINIFITPSYVNESGNELEFSYLREDAQFWLVIGDNVATDRDSGKELNADELKALLNDVQTIIQPGLEQLTQTN
jgi:hypothetical protein